MQTSNAPAGRARHAELHRRAKQKVAKKPKQVTQVRERGRVAERKIEVAIPECPGAVTAHHDPDGSPQDLAKACIVGQRVPQSKHAKPIPHETQPASRSSRRNELA